MQITSRIPTDQYIEMVKLCKQDNVAVNDWIAEAIRLRILRERRPRKDNRRVDPEAHLKEA